MPRVTLQYSPEEVREAQAALRSQELLAALSEVRARLLRPSWRHGYPDPDVQAAYERGGAETELVVSHLCSLYREILDEYGLTELVD